MAREVRAYAATIPAGTPASAPIVVDMSFPTRIVEELEILIPPGPNGLVGFRVANAGVPVIPYNVGGWIIANNETLHIPLEGQITSGSWQLVGYNTGVYDHTIYPRFLLAVAGGGAVALSAPTSAADLSQLPQTFADVVSVPAPPDAATPDTGAVPGTGTAPP